MRSINKKKHSFIIDDNGFQQRIRVSFTQYQIRSDKFNLFCTNFIVMENSMNISAIFLICKLQLFNTSFVTRTIWSSFTGRSGFASFSRNCSPIQKRFAHSYNFIIILGVNPFYIKNLKHLT